MEKEKKKVEIFGFYGGDIHTAGNVASGMRRSGKYHAAWAESDILEPNGFGWYVKYIPA